MGKTVLIRLSDDLHAKAMDWAKKQETPLATLLRQHLAQQINLAIPSAPRGKQASPEQEPEVKLPANPWEWDELYMAISYVNDTSAGIFSKAELNRAFSKDEQAMAKSMKEHPVAKFRLNELKRRWQQERDYTLKFKPDEPLPYPPGWNKERCE